MHEYEHLIHAENLEKATIAVLRKEGYRITESRKQVIKVLASQVEFVTIDDIAIEVENHDIHRTTTYRIIDLLRQLGLVTSEVSQNGAVSVHLLIHSENHGHSHVRCIQCQELASFPTALLKQVQPRLYEETGFVVQEFSGVCSNCSPQRTLAPSSG